MTDETKKLFDAPWTGSNCAECFHHIFYRDF